MQLNKILMKELIQWFLNYASMFTSPEPEKEKMFAVKKEHSMIVCHEIGQLGQEMHLDQDAIILARIMGLFHDVGRFEQAKRFGTFKDSCSLDHGELGEQILRENQVINKLDHVQRELVFKAVRYHNRKMLPSGEDRACLFYTSLLRDADKLDIYRVIRNKLTGDPHFGAVSPSGVAPCNGGCSKKVLESLEKGSIVDYEDIKSATDYRLFLVSWVYDIKHPPTAKRLKERRYIAQLQQGLPGIPQINQAVCNALEFLEKKASGENGGLSLAGRRKRAAWESKSHHEQQFEE